MSIEYVSSTEYPDGYPSGQIVEFNISAAKDTSNQDIKYIRDTFVFLEERSFGKIYKRRDNNDYWYTNADETIARFVTSKQLDLFTKWELEKLLPSDSQLAVLSEIGGLPSSQYYIGPKNLRFPCQVITNEGKSIDLCILYFSESPPYQSNFKNVMLLSTIKEIFPSKLALSHTLRLSSMLVEDIRMAFFPFMVKTIKGDLLTYNGITEFASTGDIKGDEILAEVPFSYDKFKTISDVPVEDITYIVGKWSDGLEKLFIQYRNELEEREMVQQAPQKKTVWQKLFNI
jgi:hypothetical protein